jgi:hypothetical protein
MQFVTAHCTLQTRVAHAHCAFAITHCTAGDAIPDAMSDAIPDAIRYAIPDAMRDAMSDAIPPCHCHAPFLYAAAFRIFAEVGAGACR